MRRRTITCSLLTALLVLVTFSASAQSFSSFILSGKSGELAAGDLSFRTPELAAHNILADVSFGSWTPGSLSYFTLQAGGFLPVSDKLGFRLDYRNNLFSSFDRVDENGNVKGSVKPGEQRILAGVSIHLAEFYYIDVNAKYLSTTLDESKASAFAGDIGASYHKDALTVGLKLADLGTKYEFGSTAYSLPMRILAGGSYRIDPSEKHAVTVGADLGYILPQEYKAFTAAAGVEYTFSQMVMARAGYHFSSAVAPRFASFGLGFALKDISLDAAYLLGPGGNAWTVGVHAAL